MKKSYKVAGASAVLLGLFALAISPVVQPPFPDDENGPGGNIVTFQPPFPDDENGPGGNIIAHSFPFPDDSVGGNINS